MTSRLVSSLAAGSLVASILLYLGLPLFLVVRSALTGASPAGFGRGAGQLIRLAANSIGIAFTAAAIAACICFLASTISRFAPRFHSLYRIWLVGMLFTNPVFLVFGFSIVLANVPPLAAVIMSSAYILLPLCGLLIHAAVTEVKLSQINAALSLGASPFRICVSHILPAVRRQLLAAILLSTFYCLGFYLTPAFVGLGRIVTIGTAIYTSANSVGDWTAATQLCCVAICAQLTIVLVWIAFLSTVGRSRRIA